MKHSNRTQKKQSSRVLFAIAALVISIAVIGCNDGGIAPVVLKFSFGPFETRHYQGNYAFTMEAEVDEQTKSISFDKSIPDVTDIPVRIEIAQGAQLIVGDQTYDGPLVSFTYDTSLTEIRIEETGDPESYTLSVMIRRESVAQTIENMQGTNVNAVAIFAEANFEYVRDNPSGNFFLVNDITLTENFEPIGPDTDPTKLEYKGTPFTGTFEGNSKTISNLKIAKPEKNHIGFFGAIREGGEVRNLRLILADGDATAPSIEGRSNVGALAGESTGTISNVGVEGGYVKGNHIHIGGLVGAKLLAGSIKNSYATVRVEGKTAVGGLVGWKENSTGNIENSYATGRVSGNFSVGGLVGHKTKNGSIKNSYATGNVKGGTNVGGFVGWLNISSGSNGSIENSYATGKVEGTAYLGGFVGAMNRPYPPTPNTYFDATLTGQSQGVGNDSNATGIDPYYTYADNQKVYTAASGNGVLIEQRTHFPRWDFTGTWIMQVGEWPRLAWQQ